MAVIHCCSRCWFFNVVFSVVKIILALFFASLFEEHKGIVFYSFDQFCIADVNYRHDRLVVVGALAGSSLAEAFIVFNSSYLDAGMFRAEFGVAAKPTAACPLRVDERGESSSFIKHGCVHCIMGLWSIWTVNGFIGRHVVRRLMGRL